MLPALSTRRFSLPALSASNSFRHEIDQLFDQFFGSFSGPGESALARGWNAPVSIWDDEQHVYVEVEVPGMSQDDLEVVVQDGYLRIRGERKMPQGERNYWYNERTMGRFERVISLPDVIDADSIEAQVRDGILAVTLQKTPGAQPRKVAIKAG